MVKYVKHKVKPFKVAPLLVVLVALSSCGGEFETPAEALRMVRRGLTNAFVNEPYSVNLQAVGGVSPYNYSLRDGRLPPGITLQGGTLRGTPTQTGRFQFTITVSDANLQRNVEEFTLEVTEPPPAQLVLNLPQTEMRGPFMVRASVSEARELQGMRTALSWDRQRFRLTPGSLRVLGNNLVMFRQDQGGVLNVDVAVLGGTISGNQAVFEFELTPTEPSTPEMNARSEFLSQGGRHAFSRIGSDPAPEGDEAPPASEETPDTDLSGEDEQDDDPDNPDLDNPNLDNPDLDNPDTPGGEQ